MGWERRRKKDKVLLFIMGIIFNIYHPLFLPSKASNKNKIWKNVIEKLFIYEFFLPRLFLSPVSTNHTFHFFLCSRNENHWKLINGCSDRSQDWSNIKKNNEEAKCPQFNFKHISILFYDLKLILMYCQMNKCCVALS